MFSAQNPWDESGYDEREVEGYKIAAQPGRSIEISHKDFGRLTVVEGTVGVLIEALEWAREIQWEADADG